MAISIDSSTSAAQSAGSTTRMLGGIVVGGTGKLMIACVFHDNNGVGVIDVTFAGVNALTQITPPTSQNFVGLSVWHKTNPSVTTGSVVATMIDSGLCSAIAVHVIDGADLGTIFRDIDQTSGGGTATGTLTLTTLAGDLVLDFANVYAPSTTGMTQGAGQTEKYNFTTTTGEVAGSSKAAAGASTGMSYSWTDSITFAYQAVAIMPVGAAPTVNAYYAQQ